MKVFEHNIYVFNNLNMPYNRYWETLNGHWKPTLGRWSDIKFPTIPVAIIAAAVISLLTMGDTQHSSSPALPGNASHDQLVDQAMWLSLPK